jgi:hypothetical protein
MKVVMLSAPHIQHLYSPGDTLVLISVRTINKTHAKEGSTLLEGDMILSEHIAYILAHK